MKIDVIENDGKVNTNLTLTPDRCTLKIAEKHLDKKERVISFVQYIIDNIKVEQSFRGCINSHLGIFEVNLLNNNHEKSIWIKEKI